MVVVVRVGGERPARDERARDRQIASSVLAGAAGVTGEDLSTTENKHIV